MSALYRYLISEISIKCLRLALLSAFMSNKLSFSRMDACYLAGLFQIMEKDLNRYYYLRLAAAYTRGVLDISKFSGDLSGKSMAELSERECADLFQYGWDAGLKLHRFKRSAALPRVQKILGTLKGLRPSSLLDIGTGRCVFLWPLIDAFPLLPVSCIDRLGFRCAGIQAAGGGGIGNLRALQMDAGRLAFEDRAFDGITLLETLEHTPDPETVVREACRVTGRFVLVSVPSKADNNPGHLHLFTSRHLGALFDLGGNFNIKFDAVLNHIIAIALRS